MIVVAKFNKTISKSTKTVNAEGGVAYQPTMKLELMLRTMSFLMSGDSFYEKEKDVSDRIANLVKLVSKEDPWFVLQLAAYARNYMHLRTVPVYLLVEYAKAGTKTKGAYKYVPFILKRADEPAEAIAYYLKSSGTRKVPAMLKKGISLALNRWDEYQFGKYNREGEVTLKDVVFITHPKPASQENQVLFDKIVDGTLKTPETWEVEISKNGSTKEAWESIIPKMGYMALLRNLRNFVQKKVDPKIYIPIIENPTAVKNAQQFPYRFYSAYKELQAASAPTKVLDAVNTAMELSVKNVPRIPGRTAIFSDNSGSMTMAGPSQKSTVRNIEIAALFGAISLHVCDEAFVGVFGQTFAPVPLSKKSTILDNMEKIRNKNVGHSTNAWLALKWLRETHTVADRIFVFSDTQCYNSYGNFGMDGSVHLRGETLASELTKYRRDVNPECRMYSFDLAQYGLLQFPEHDPLTCPIGGYSDTIFSFVPMFEESRETMLKTIEDYYPIKEVKDGKQRM